MPTELRSFAKINLGLAIGPPRPDGYHALTTVYQTVDAYDRIRVEARPAAASRIRVTTNDARVPTDERNTAWRAADQTLAALGVTAEVTIHIEKRLPVQGGLGAGSANAAAAMLALERELTSDAFAHSNSGDRDELRLSGPERLRIAAAIGSDVPLFLVGGAVLGLGRGEEVYPLPDLPATECVLATPQVAVSTAQAFRDWDARHSEALGSLTPEDAAATLKGLGRLIAAAWSEPHSSGVFPPLRTERDSGDAEQLKDLAETPLLALVHTGICKDGIERGAVANAFEEVVFPQHPFLGEIKRVLAGLDLPEEDRAIHAALSGSGSALFGLYRTAGAAERAADRLAARGVTALRTQTLPRDRYWLGMAMG